MIALANIQANHDYYEGICPYIRILPGKDLWRFEKNNRFRFRINNGNTQVYIENDLSPLTEIESLCFWVTYIQYDFIRYSQYQDTDINPKTPLHWMAKDASSILEVTAETEHPDIKDQDTVPPNSLGIIQIPSGYLNSTTRVNFLLNFQLNFQSKKTYWEYHIYTSLPMFNFNDWILNLTDTRDAWQFKIIEQENDRTVFRSTDALPYLARAEKRIMLSWQKTNNTLENREYKISIPFPNYQNQQLKSDMYTTITYIYI